MANCSVCGTPLGDINDPCPNCLPNFYGRSEEPEAEDIYNAQMADLLQENGRLNSELEAMTAKNDMAQRACAKLEVENAELRRQNTALLGVQMEYERLKLRTFDINAHANRLRACESDEERAELDRRVRESLCGEATVVVTASKFEAKEESESCQ